MPLHYATLGRRIPLHNSTLAGRVVEQAIAAEEVPSDTARTTVVAGELRADFFRNDDRLVAGVAAEHEHPARLRVVPRIGRIGVRVERGRVDGATLRDEVLLDEADAFIATDLAGSDALQALSNVLVQGLEFILERAKRGRMRDGDIVVIDEAGDAALAHVVDHGLDVTSAEGDVVGGCRRSVVRDRHRGRARAAGRGSAELALVEAVEHLDVESLAGVVLQSLVDDLQNVVLGQGSQLAGVGTCRLLTDRLFIRSFCIFLFECRSAYIIELSQTV